MSRNDATATTVDPTPSSPLARRSKAPRWFDLRMLIGLVLVAGSVVAGAKVISAADKTVTVWAVTRDLAAGTTLDESDLETVDVRLDENAKSYLAASTNPAGKTLGRDVGQGELLAVQAIAKDESLVSLALSVPASHVPLTVAKGDRISLYATIAPPAGSPQATASTALVVDAVPVADLSDRSQGALSVGSGELQVVIKVASCAVEGILDKTVDKVLTVVEVPSGTPAGATC